MRDGLSDLHPSRIVARRMHELESELERARAWQRRHSKGSDTTSRWGLEPPVAPQQEESWFITYLDMMTLLLVVMVVMLAFSGTLGQEAEPSQADEPLVTAELADGTTAATLAQPPLVEATDTETAAPAPATPVDASAEASPSDSPATPLATGGNGLLPGGSGLLPEHGSLAVAGTHPADIEPLPHAQHLIAHNDIPPPARLSEELYPGWSSADLAASFIGPPRPEAQASADPTGDNTPHDDTAVLAAAPSEDDTPSEGETLAAGLSLGELGSDVEVLVSERSVSFRVNSEILFDSSQADLSLSGLSVLRRIVGVLSSTNHAVTVEGHTDSVAVRRNARFPSNWELSSARAGSVVRYLQANGIESSRLKAVGYADTRPIGDNHTPEGRASNRRVELIIEKETGR